MVTGSSSGVLLVFRSEILIARALRNRRSNRYTREVNSGRT